MSTSARLKRLGLYHLKDDPQALQKEMERQLNVYRERRRRVAGQLLPGSARKGPAESTEIEP